MDLFSIFFSHNTLFTDTISAIVLVIGFIFSVFLGPDKNLQGLFMSGSSANSDKLISRVYNITAVTRV
jgi:hypothetical protein